MRGWLVCLALLGGVAVADETVIDASAVGARVGKSVVKLTDRVNGEESGHGSGFFVAPGVVVTNHHVIAEVDGEMIATLQDGKDLRVLGVLVDDEPHDLALLRTDGDGPTPLVLAPLPTLHVTEAVTAVGSPLGFDQTFSTGIIAALRDEMPKEWKDRGANTSGPFVQHTANIAPGSSGGPLVDEDGRVVGINHSSIEGAGLFFAERVDVLAGMLTPENLAKKPKPLGSDIRRNLVISAAFLGAIVLAGVVASFVSRRHRKPRAKTIIRA